MGSAKEAQKKVRARSEQGEEHSPGRAPEGPVNLSGKAAGPGDVHSIQERPGNVRNKRANKTDPPDQDRPPGGQMGEKKALEAVEVDSNAGNVGDCGECHREGPSSEENERIIETSTQR